MVYPNAGQRLSLFQSGQRFGLKQSGTPPRRSPMHRSTIEGKRSDGGTGWLILGGLAAMGMLTEILLYLASAIANSGPSGASALTAIGVVACGAFAAVALGPIGRSIGKRILQGGAGAAASDEELQDLRLQLEDMQHALAEAQERIDFTERMIAGSKERVPEELH